MSKVVPVILAGGSGTRLWPVSRDALPKQFLPLVGERSTYQDTLLRVADANLFAPPIVITGADFRFFARRQAEDLGIDAAGQIDLLARLPLNLLTDLLDHQGLDLHVVEPPEPGLDLNAWAQRDDHWTTMLPATTPQPVVDLGLEQGPGRPGIDL
jgi:hypothetical protein